MRAMRGERRTCRMNDAFALLIGAALLGVPSALGQAAEARRGHEAETSARAVPLTMDILITEQTIEDYDPNNPGAEALWSYVIKNTTVGGSLEGMGIVVFPVGSHDGVYDTVAPPDWQSSIGTDHTTFISYGNNIQANGGTGLFQLASHYLESQYGLAQASGPGGAFEPYQTTFPAACSADLDDDNDTDVFDFALFAANFGQAVEPGTSGDFDEDGQVTVFDFGIFAADFGCAP